MKKLLTLLLLLSSLYVVGQTPVAVTGTVQTPTGAPATSGYVQFDLQPQNQSMNYAVPGTLITVPQTGQCGISTSGQVLNQALNGPCQVWGNDVITPANSAYTITICANGVGCQPTILNNALVIGTSVDLSTIKLTSPQPVIGTVINGSPLVTQSVQPDVPNARVVGTPIDPYSAGYFVNIYCGLPGALVPCAGSSGGISPGGIVGTLQSHKTGGGFAGENPVFADQYPTTDAAISAANPSGTGGIVLFTGASSCPTSIPSNTALINLGAWFDYQISGALLFPQDPTFTQVKLSPCGNITIAPGSQNISIVGLTLDFNNSGNGLAFVSSSGVHLEKTSIINAGSNSTPVLSFATTGENGTFNSVRNTLDHVSLNGNQSPTSPVNCGVPGCNYASASLFLGSNSTGQCNIGGNGGSCITLNQGTDLLITGSMKCGIQIEKNVDTNWFYGVNINAASAPSNSAPLCVNTLHPNSDQDSDANQFTSIQNTAGGFSNFIRAGQTTGNILWGSSGINTSNMAILGGVPQFTILTAGLGNPGVNGLTVGSLSLLNSNVGTLTDSGGTIAWAVGGNQFGNATVTLNTVNSTFTPTGLWNGGSYVVKVVQDGTGSRHLTLGTGGAGGCANWTVAGGGGGAITPTTTAGAIDILTFIYDGVNCYANFIKNFT